MGYLEPAQGRNKKIFLLSMSFFFMFGFSAVSYLLPVYYAHVGFTAVQAGLLVSSFYFSALIFRLVLGNVLTRLGFKKMFVTGGVLAVLGSGWIVFAGDSFFSAFAARFIFGAGSSFTQIALGAYQSLAFKQSERGFAFSLIMAGGLAPMMTAVPLADKLLSSGFFTAYILIPLIMAAAMFAITLLINTDDVVLDSSQTSANPFSGMGRCFKVPALALSLFCIFLFSVADAASSFMSSMTSSYGLMASYFLSSNAVVGVFVRLFLGKLLDKYPRWKLAVPITAGMSLALFFASVSPSRASLIALGLLFGVGMGFGFPLHLALVSDNAPSELQPQAVSLMWFLYAFDFAMVPLVMSYISGFTTPVTGFRAVVAFTLFGTVYAGRRWYAISKARAAS